MEPKRIVVAGLVLLFALARTPAAHAQIGGPEAAERLALALERIASALERIERAQGQEVWLRRAEMSAIAQRELDRQLGQARSRLASLEEEREMLLVHLDQVEELEHDPNTPSDQIESQRREVEGRLDLVTSLRRSAEARVAELEARLATAQRDLEDRLSDIDRQLRAP